MNVFRVLIGLFIQAALTLALIGGVFYFIWWIIK